MTEEQLKTARELQKQGWSLRGIAAELNVALASLFRALKEEDSEPGPAASSTSTDPPSEAGQETETPASSTLANGERPHSALLAARIAETRTQLATVEADLAELPQRKELLLAAEELDRQALATLEEHGSRLAKEAALLRERIPLLQNRQEGEEAKEAEKRLREIRAEADSLREQEAPVLAAFAEAVKNLEACAQPIAALHRQHKELSCEEVFLVDRYRLPRLGIPQLGDMPNAMEASNTVLSVLASVHNHQSPWQRKRSQWEAQGRPRPVAAKPEASPLSKS